MNPEHVEIVRQGREAIDAWRRADTRERLDLGGTDMTVVRHTSPKIYVMHRGKL